MGIDNLKHDEIKINFSHKKIKDETFNSKVALWHLPYDKRYSIYDTDKSSWFESVNENYNNEIERVEKKLAISLNRFKVLSRTLKYDDGSVTETSKYPNGNIVEVRKSNNFVYTRITDKSGELAAEKYYNYDSNEGRKIIYKHITQGDNTFTIVRVFSYDTAKNRSTDVINYGYTSLESTLTNGCTFEKEYYLLNGNEIKTKKINDFEYSVKDKNGNKIIFTEY